MGETFWREELTLDRMAKWHKSTYSNSSIAIIIPKLKDNKSTPTAPGNHGCLMPACKCQAITFKKYKTINKYIRTINKKEKITKNCKLFNVQVL